METRIQTYIIWLVACSNSLQHPDSDDWRIYLTASGGAYAVCFVSYAAQLLAIWP